MRAIVVGDFKDQIMAAMLCVSNPLLLVRLVVVGTVAATFIRLIMHGVFSYLVGDLKPDILAKRVDLTAGAVIDSVCKGLAMAVVDATLQVVTLMAAFPLTITVIARVPLYHAVAPAKSTLISSTLGAKRGLVGDSRTLRVRI